MKRLLGALETDTSLEQHLDRVKICLRIIDMPTGMNTWGFRAKTHQEFEVSETGWRRNSIPHVKWMNIPELNDAPEVLFSLPRDININESTLTMWRVLRSLTGTPLPDYCLDISCSCLGQGRITVQLFDPEDDPKDSPNVPLGDAADWLLEPDCLDVLSVSVVMPPPAPDPREVVQFCTDKKEINSYVPFLPSRWDQIRTEMHRLIHNNLHPYYALLFHAMAESYTEDLLQLMLDSVHMLRSEQSWFMLWHMNQGYAFARTTLIKFLWSGMQCFMKTTQFVIARRDKAEADLIAAESLEKLQHGDKKGPKKKHKKRKRIPKSRRPKASGEVPKEDGIAIQNSDARDEELSVIGPCLACDSENVIQFIPCNDRCLCESCWLDYYIKFDNTCICCRKVVECIKGLQ